MRKTKVLIVGGGFSGIKAALELEKHDNFKVTLLTDNSDFRYYPTLFRTATGGKRMISSIPLSELLDNKKIDLVLGSAETLNRSDKKISDADGNEFGYDILILAMGVKTNYFGIKGLAEYSYGIKTVEQAEELKAHLHEQICDENKFDYNYIVIGGGPTGVELAGALPNYLKKISKCHDMKANKIHVSLVEAAPRLLPRMPKSISSSVARNLRRKGVKIHLNSKVEAETIDGLLVNGRKINSQTVVWTAGVANHPFFLKNNFQLNRNGRVRVNDYMEAESDIFVLGDNADSAYSGMAQTALYDGDFVAKNLIRLSRDEEPQPYIPKKPIYVFPAGEKWAAVVWGRFRFYGFIGWILRRAGDFAGYKDYEPWHKAGKRWLAEDDYEDECPKCSL